MTEPFVALESELADMAVSLRTRHEREVALDALYALRRLTWIPVHPLPPQHRDDTFRLKPEDGA